MASEVSVQFDIVETSYLSPGRFFFVNETQLVMHPRDALMLRVGCELTRSYAELCTMQECVSGMWRALKKLPTWNHLEKIAARARGAP